MKKQNIGASVRARLLNRARETKQDFNLILTRFCLERLLYRVSISSHAEQFLLKGALLFDLWFDIPHRPTRDIDFLGLGSSELKHLEEVFQNICKINLQDGVELNPATVRASEIRKDSNYTGVRIIQVATIDRAHCRVQVDIGFGDAVTPGPEEVEYPKMLIDFEAPKLKVYPRYTVVAEKFEALTVLGISNSRMKDYFDLWILSQHSDFDGETLAKAIQATFARRKSKLTKEPPFGLSSEFAQDDQKQTQWKAFLQKNDLQRKPLEDVVHAIASFLLPPAKAAHNRESFPLHWAAGGSWVA